MDNLLPIKILSNIPQGKGVLWEHIEVFKNQLLEIEGVLEHKAGTKQSEDSGHTLILSKTNCISNNIRNLVQVLCKIMILISRTFD